MRTMWTCCTLAALSPLLVSTTLAEVPDTIDDAEAISLLQLATRTRESATTGATFGCESQGNAANKWVCGEWGDPHRFASWRDSDLDNNPDRMGWHWLVKSKDGQMQVQVFFSKGFRMPPVVSAIAGRFGATTFKILKKGRTEKDFQLIINGEIQPDAPTKRFADGFFVKPRSQVVGNTGDRTGGNVAVCMDSADKRFTLRMDAYMWQPAFQSGGGVPINLEVIADDADIDKGFDSLCTDESPNQAKLVSNDDIIVSPEENRALCDLEGLPGDQCQNPPPLPPVPPVEQACADNGIAFADAQAACEAERTKGHGMFEGCVEDCCNGGNLDQCTQGPEDFDNLAGEEGGNDDASAVGDPHINTVNEHTFDVH